MEVDGLVNLMDRIYMMHVILAILLCRWSFMVRLCYEALCQSHKSTFPGKRFGL